MLLFQMLSPVCSYPLCNNPLTVLSVCFVCCSFIQNIEIDFCFHTIPTFPHVELYQPSDFLPLIRYSKYDKPTNAKSRPSIVSSYSRFHSDLMFPLQASSSCPVANQGIDVHTSRMQNTKGNTLTSIIRLSTVSFVTSL